MKIKMVVISCMLVLLGILIFPVTIQATEIAETQEKEKGTIDEEKLKDLIELVYDESFKTLTDGDAYILSQMIKDMGNEIEKELESHSLTETGAKFAESFSVEGFIWELSKEFGTDIYEENLIDPDKLALADKLDLVYALAKYAGKVSGDEVDIGVTKFVETLRLGSTLLDEFTADELKLLMFGPKYIVDSSADVVEFITTSEEYEEWKSDIETEEEFKEKFWDTAIDGVVVGMLRFPADLFGLTMELAGIEIDGFRWSSLGDHIEEIYYEKLKLPDSYTQTIYSESGTHLEVTWGPTIDDFNVIYVP